MLSMARLFNRNASRFSRLFVRLRVNKDMTTGGVDGYGEYTGQQMMVIQLPPGQTANAIEIQDSTGGAAPATGNVLWSVDCNGFASSSGTPTVKGCVTRVPLTAAQIIAMGTTPVQILADPLATQYIAVKLIAVELDLTATAFNAGGAVEFFYHGQTTEIMAQELAAATLNGGAGQSVYLLQPVNTAGGSVVTVGKGIVITNATSAATLGTGAAVVTIFYDLVTLG